MENKKRFNILLHNILWLLVAFVGVIIYISFSPVKVNAKTYGNDSQLFNGFTLDISYNDNFYSGTYDNGGSQLFTFYDGYYYSQYYQIFIFDTWLLDSDYFINYILFNPGQIIFTGFNCSSVQIATRFYGSKLNTVQTISQLFGGTWSSITDYYDINNNVSSGYLFQLYSSDDNALVYDDILSHNNRYFHVVLNYSFSTNVSSSNVYYLDDENKPFAVAFKNDFVSSTYNNYITGYNSGYNSGYIDGAKSVDTQTYYNTGYNAGYVVGLTESSSDYGIGDLLFSVLNQPIVVLSNLFAFTLFGTNVWYAIVSLLALSIVVWVIRRFFLK